ncbi:MAG TPA: L-aspartate oxidase [bacterium]|nr:L-aspartate oxidase [bacterium]HOL47963.1 L-aspartate oxidase [bacterium]HPQ18049.1 L-aspartate oxidase [bacterium]
MIENLVCDVVIIGSGVAALTAILNIDNKYRTIAITKGKLNECSTYLAQGGIAVPVSESDIEVHIQDTLKVGSYFNNYEIVKFIIESGYYYINELINNGFEFDTDKNGNLLRTKEAGHSEKRILHWGGDITGQGIFNSLFKLIKKKKKNIKFLEEQFAYEIIIENNSVKGLKIISRKKNELYVIYAPVIIIASGGCGQIFRETTVPETITGDGIILAYKAGAEIKDIEFIQFHPTTFYFPGAPRFLITEAIRGEGAYLINNNNERFMNKYDERLELAPRDIVSRSILFEVIKTNTSNVFLDLRHLEKEKIIKRFPNIYKFCLKYKIDFTKDPIPVFPAAHYLMGGIKINKNAQTNINGLFACGECACINFHGANRLASNSLLEGIVMGRQAGINANNYLENQQFKIEKNNNQNFEDKNNFHLLSVINFDDFKNALKTMMWKNAGILKEGNKLKEALNKIKKWQSFLFGLNILNYQLEELKNMILLSELIIEASLWREESRGAHYRIDYPEINKKFEKHLVIKKSENKNEYYYDDN